MLAMYAPAIVTIVLDQATKWLVARRLAPGRAVRVGFGIDLRHVVSRTAAARWGSVGAGEVFIWLGCLMVLSLAALGVGLFSSAAAQSGIGAALGGAASNLYDRRRSGRVVDFLDVGWWPVFNVADVAISVGAAVALGSLVLDY